LKDKAWDDDLDGETCVYLVKNPEGHIALFFSIKCGLLYEKTNYEKLQDEEHEFVETVVQAKLNNDEESVRNLYEAGEGVYKGDVDRLFRIADEHISRKKEGKRLNEKDSTLRVSKCYSAIELQHFCRNASFQEEIEMEVPMGFGLFWETIVPEIIKIVGLIGCKYMYLFAADNSEEASDNSADDVIRKLVRYYKNDLLFEEVSNITILKPDYDEDCKALYQDIKGLEQKKKTVWGRYFDLESKEC